MDAKLYVVSLVKRDDTFAEIAAQYEAAKYVREYGGVLEKESPNPMVHKKHRTAVKRKGSQSSDDPTNETT